MIEKVKAASINSCTGVEPSTASASQLPRSVPFMELRNTLPSDTAIISPFVDQLMPIMGRFRREDPGNFEIDLAIREALANAIVHGNERNPEKLVHVRCRIAADGEVLITIQDEGRGFDTATVPDPTAAENLFRDTGRGIYLMRTLMDEVRFEQRGAVVHMRKGVTVQSGAESETI